MVRCVILTAWSNVGTAERPRYRPTVVDDYHLTDWTDVTGQPPWNLIPDPNLMVLEVVTDDATLETIEADARYQVLQSEEVVTDAER